jgi:AP-4 complex subunit epsilon-1
LDLLFRMTNAVNVEFIVDKLLSFLRSSGDDHFRSDLVNQITQCAERFAPSNTWYVQTIIQVFELAGDKVKSSVAQTLTQLIAEGAEFDDDDENIAVAKDDELRTEAVEHFLDLLNKPKLPTVLAKTMAWVLGEYGYLSTSCSKEIIMSKLCDLASSSWEAETKCSVVTALAKLIAQAGTCPQKVLSQVTFFSQSKNLDLQQRCIEILALLKQSDIMVDVLPVDASCEDIDIDEELSFLNGFIAEAIHLGARRYDPPESFLKMLEGDDGSDKKAALKITPYEMPKIPAPVSAALSSVLPSVGSPAFPSGPTPLGPALTNQQGPALSIATAQGNQLLNARGAQQVWGKKPEPPLPAPPAPEPQPSPKQQKPPAMNGSSPVVSSSLNASAGQWGGQPTSQAAASSPVVPPAPPAPKVLTEKEKMAQALFGGISSGKPGASSSSAAGKKRVTSTSTSAASTIYTPPTSASSQPNQYSPSQPQSVQPPKDAPSIDLFHDMAVSSAPSSSSHPVNAKPSMTSSSNELLDLMSDPYIPTAASHHQPIHPVSSHTQPHNGNSMDLLAGLHVAHSPVPHHVSSPVALPAPSSSSSSSLISDVFGNIDLSGGGSTLLQSGLSDNVKPLVINTAEFGRRWGSTPVDSKQSVPVMFSRLDLETLRKAMPSSYHPVESIPATQECIFAATATNVGAVILVHAKINMPRRSIDLIVKSNSTEICQKELSSVSLSLSNFRG